MRESQFSLRLIAFETFYKKKDAIAFLKNPKSHCSKISVKILSKETLRRPLFHNKQNLFFERHLITITENITGWDLLLRLFYNLSSSPFSSCHKTRIYFDMERYIQLVNDRIPK